MKIGFDAKRFFNNFTGLGNYSRFIVNALAGSYPDHDYLLYTPKLRSHPEVNAILQNKAIQVRQPTAFTSALKLESVWRSYRLGKVASDDGVQIFHGLSNELPLTKPAGLKTVLTVHDLIFKRYPAFYKPIDIKIYNWKLKKACESADQIIAISNQTAEDLMEFMKVDPTKIKVVYQGCHPNFKRTYTTDELNDVRVRYNLPQDFVLNVGTIESRKNALLLLQSLEYSKHNIPVVMVGRATPYLVKLQDYIAANGLAKRVSFIHNAAFADLPLIYHLAKVFVYPSLFEGFGIPIVEAIACNVPVISSQGSCFAEAGGPDCMYVDPKNPEQLAHALDTVLADEATRGRMISESKNYIKRFEPQVIASDVMNVYKSLL